MPAGFFDPGSDPFSGVVQLGRYGHGSLRRDTTVQRHGPALLPDGAVAATVPIELIALNLVSPPITVTYSGGSPPSNGT